MSDPNAIKIYLEDMHDGNHLVFTSTKEYWERLIAPAVAHNHPIDGGTVNSELLTPLIEDGKPITNIPSSAKYIIPLV